MDTTDHITSLIETVSQLPNSLARNKTVSHLHDALVWAEKLEPLQHDTEAQETAATCICPTGGRRRDCPALLHHNDN